MVKAIRAAARRVRSALRSDDTDALYKVLYDEVHDLDQARDIASQQTRAAFERQWSDLPEGEYLLSDPWFRANVDRILSEEELLLPRDWFPGKRVLDAGCGNGRWSYGLAKLGADVTAVDVSESALNATRAALDGRGTVLRASLDELDLGTFDLVFCWGVAHHVGRFNQSLDRLVAAVGDEGVLYLYLYGRDSLPMRADLRLFRDRVAYNVLMTDEEREKFLLRKSGGDRKRLHNVHDIYAPLINRRFTFEEIREMLEGRGLANVRRTIQHTELFVRATRPGVTLPDLPPARPPYWFEGRHDTVRQRT